tara:strand:- start:456 stop:620 length:165 start_codon:yes stop_codon:yes gene_type:complete
MTETFYDCKSRNSELASKAQSINTLAYECNKEVDKLLSEHKLELYQPVKKDSLY